jgi:hypothetical protein
VPALFEVVQIRLPHAGGAPFERLVLVSARHVGGGGGRVQPCRVAGYLQECRRNGGRRVRAAVTAWWWGSRSWMEVVEAGQDIWPAVLAAVTQNGGDADAPHPQ